MKSILARFLIIVSIALLPSLGFQVYQEIETRGVRERMVDQEALRLLRVVDLDQQRIIDGAEQVLDAIGGALVVQDGGFAGCERLLANVVGRTLRYAAAVVVGLDGRNVCASMMMSSAIDVSDRPYFQNAARSDHAVIGEYVIGRASGKPTIPIAKAFRDAAGKPAGVVVLSLNLEWLSYDLARLDLGPGAVASIIDRNGVILARRPGGSRYIGVPILPENRYVLNGNQAHTFRMNNLDDGRAMIVAYSPPYANPEGFSVGVGLNIDGNFAEMMRANRNGLILIVTGIAFALAATVLLGMLLIRRPIKQLLVGADRWRAGDLAARIGLPERDGEFGQLAAAFDRMAAAQETREDALRQSEQRARAKFEQAAVGMAEIGLDGAWLRVNDRLCAITGYSRDELLARKDQDTTHPDDLEVDLPLRTKLLAGDASSYTATERYIRKDGAVVWVNIAVSVIRDGAGRPERFVSVIEDISELKRVEAELRGITAELERRVREEITAREAAQARAAHGERLSALSLLAGGIANDFNNVLQGVLGACTMIERWPDDPANVRRGARVAIETIERGASVTGRLLLFCRRGDLHPTSLDVSLLLRRLRDRIVPLVGARIEVRLKLDADLPPVVADELELEAVLVGLATNARDAMPDGGVLTIATVSDIVHRVGPAHPAALAPGRYVRMCIIDNGAGMDANTLRHAGEPFFTTKASRVGAGLGLPTAVGFAEQSGGAMRIDSTSGMGTTVTLWLPTAASANVLSIPSTTGRPAGTLSGDGWAVTRARVLLVDDDTQVREMLAMDLEDAGYEVIIAESGAEAIAILAAGEAVDILVSDLAMPGMDGAAVIRAARNRVPGLPALLLSGYFEDEAARATIGAFGGAICLLSKPFKPDELRDRLIGLLATRRDIARA